MPDKRLIDANALKKMLIEVMERIKENPTMKRDEMHIIAGSHMLCDMIEDAPTIDAMPVVHGRVVWKNRFMGGFVPDITITDRAGEKHTGTLDTTHYEPVPYCSVCGKELGVSSLAYCPNCGAKMDAQDMDVPTKDGGAGDG